MENTFFSNPHNRLFGGLALVMAIVALGAYSYYTVQQARYYYTGPTTISVSGDGEVVTKPDVAKFSFSVTEKAADAVAAQTAATTKINDLMAAFKEAGVEEKDIKTEYYNLYPTYKYEEAPCAEGMWYCPPGESVEDGYEVTQSISIKVRDLTKSGTLLTLAGEKGADNISGLEFVVDDSSVFEDEARAKAIADAKAQAEVLARDLGVKLGDMVGYYEDEGYVTPYYGMGDMMAKESSSGPATPTGENTITSKVTLTYQIR